MTAPAGPRRTRWSIALPPGLDLFLRVGARLILLAVIGVLAYEAWQGNIPRDPEGGPFTEDVLVPLQVALLVLAGVALLVSFQWMAVAAAIVAVAGGALGVLATLQYEPPFGFLVLFAFLAPAVMMWLDWQHRETLGKIVVLAVTTAALLAGSWFGGTQVYAAYLGPTHDDSPTARLPDSPVRWIWSGAVSTAGFTVAARLRDPAESAVLVVSDETGEEVARSSPRSVTDADAAVKLDVEGLAPATWYDYAIEIDGVIDEVRTGRARTFPEGAASFTVAFGACARTNSNGAVFDTIREASPDLYVNVGDLHYRNIGDDSIDRFRSAFAQVHASPAQSALYRSVPLSYIWDDHDYGPNDGDATSASRPAAWDAYRENVPHQALATGDSGAVHQAFTMGRVRFVMIDTRSERRPSEGQLLGDDQLAWLFDEILAARDSHALTVLINPTPWIGEVNPLSDGWGAYDDERRKIGAFLADNDITDLVMVSGDAHMVAIDDGTNTGYGGHDGFPLLHVASLDRPGSIKGGPYSHGTFPGGGQFGLLEVTDDGGETITVSLSGHDHLGTELVSLEVVVDADPNSSPAAEGATA